MIVFRGNSQGKLVELAPAGAALPAGTIWIDMINPDRDEDRLVEGLTGISVPTRDDMREIEESSRFYVENGTIFLTAPMLHAMDSEKPGISPITFILSGKLLVTVRYCEPRSFMNYVARASRPGNELVTARCDGTSVLVGILEAATDRLADILETVAMGLEEAGNVIFQREAKGRSINNAVFRSLLARIGSQGEFLSKVRESLAGMDRLCAYLVANLREAKTYKSEREWVRTVARDIQSLENHVDFLSNRINFLMDTTVGLISVEQNQIIKIFAVASVALMPPTLVASIYGMNFRHMPELDWIWGYPLALAAMAAVTVIPVLIFKWKGWL